MKKSLKALVLAAVTGALIAGSAFTASAAAIGQGQWCASDNGGWWYKTNADGSAFLSSNWYWIKDVDGVIRSYYFDANGWLQTNTTIDGSQVDANGRWVVNGEEQHRDEASVSYVQTIDFAAATSSPAAQSTPSTGAHTSSAPKAKKVSGQGDNPASATFSQEYANSTASGNTVTNSWAHFAMTLPGAPSINTEGAGTDWIYEASDGTAYCAFIRIDKYTAGNADLNAFINSYVADKRGFYQGAVTGQETHGGLTFTVLRKESPDPAGTTYDYTYLRSVDGTGYVQVIEIDADIYDSFKSCLDSIRTV